MTTVALFPLKNFYTLSTCGLLMTKRFRLVRFRRLIFQDDEADEEKDEVDQAFALLKNKFKESDLDRDNTITKKEFHNLLEKLSPTRRITEELVTKILCQLEDYKEGKTITFKEYLYGMYLFLKI